MHLRSRDTSNSLVLRPVGYEFADDDESWLLIEGVVVGPTESWSFVESALIVPEVHALTSWLRDAAVGLQGPGPDADLEFVELALRPADMIAAAEELESELAPYRGRASDWG